MYSIRTKCDAHKDVVQEARLDLRELLSIPYLLERKPLRPSRGTVLVRLAYPECRGARRKGAWSKNALKELERRRMK